MYEVGEERVYNLITLSHSAHARWAVGDFALTVSQFLCRMISVGFTGSGETLNKGGIPVFLLLCLKKKEARGQEA
jgi:hypothetical protein